MFVPRWWEYKDGYLRDGVGTDNNWLVYKGPLPSVPVGPYEGEREWWVNGLSYATYLAGGYSNSGPCVTIPPLSLSPVLSGKVIATAVVGDEWNNFPALAGRSIGSATVEIDWDEYPELPARVTASGQAESYALVELPARAIVGEGESYALVELPARAIVGEGSEDSLVELPARAILTDET